MKVFGKTEKAYLITVSPEELSNIIAWDEKQGSLDIEKISVGTSIDVSTKYSTIMNISNLKTKLEDSKIRINNALGELDQVNLNEIPASVR